MPKLKRPAGKYDELMTELYGAACVKYDGTVDYDALAADCGISSMTLRRRFAEPEKLTLGELRKIARAVNLSAEKIRAALPI